MHDGLLIELKDLQIKLYKLEKDLDSARMTSSNLQVEIDRYKNGPKTISQVAAPKAEKTDEFSREKVKALETELMVLKANQERVDKATELNKLAINAAVNEANAKNSAEIIELRSRIKFAEATINKLEDDKTKLAMAVGNTSVKVKEVEPQFVDVVGQISLRSLDRNAQKRKGKGSREQGVGLPAGRQGIGIRQ